MSYEYMSGLGVVTSALDIINAQTGGGGTPSSGGTKTFTMMMPQLSLSPKTSSSGGAKTFTPLFTGSKVSPTTTSGAKTATPLLTGLVIPERIPPAGMVEVPENMRSTFRAWADKAMVTDAQKRIYAAFKSLNPPLWYIPAQAYADFLNARQVVGNLLKNTTRRPDNHVRGAARKALERERTDKFFTWWKKCHSSTWAQWALSVEKDSSLQGKVPWLFYLDFQGKVLARNKGNICASSEMLSDRVGDRYMAKAGLKPVLARTLLEQQKKVNDARRASNAEKVADSARQQAQEKQSEVTDLQNTVIDLQNQLNQALNALETASNQPATSSASDDAVAQLAAQVSTLQEQLQASNQALLDAQRMAEEADSVAAQAEEEAEEVAEEVSEESFFEQYKWYLAIGGFAAVGAGLWYYFFKHKPAQAATASPASSVAPTANPDDEEPVYDVHGEQIGTFWRSAIPGRWIARSTVMPIPLFSTESPERAIEWIEDVAADVR